MDQKRLYKARGHRMVCGVCGGIAEYFGVDPTIVRRSCCCASAGARACWPIS